MEKKVKKITYNSIDFWLSEIYLRYAAFYVLERYND